MIFMRNVTCLLRFRVAETQVLLRAFESALARNGKESFFEYHRELCNVDYTDYKTCEIADKAFYWLLSFYTLTARRKII